MERRTFIKNAAIVSAGSLIVPGIIKGRISASTIQLGIIGCGDRGTEVISSMSKNANVNIIAMADLFDDKVKGLYNTLNQLNAAKGFAAIKASNMYHGSEAYLKLLKNKEVDAVLISSPAYTHPDFLEAAIAAGKHVYCEKPVATDIAGCKKAERAGQSVNGKLSVVIGFQIRYASPYVEMVKRIHRGDIGEVVNAQLYYLSSRNVIKQMHQVTEDELRIRNQFHFRALSGGILLDQGIHMLDVCNWALQDHPLKALGAGGRNLPDNFGDVWNHYQVVYKYPKNIHVSMHSTQIGSAFGDVCARFLGTRGIAEAHYSGGVFINGENKWDSGIARNESSVTPQQLAAGIFLSSLHDSNANKGKAFINSIETGKYLNEVQQGATSTLTAILGRQAAENNKEMTWDLMNNSNEKIYPKLNLSQFD